MDNKKRFSEILKKINETYANQRDFANSTGVNIVYISQYMNCYLSNPPHPKILRRIADNSKGITTYEELMRVCGYIDSNRTAMEDEAIKSLEDMVERQVPGYSLIDIVLKYIKRLEGRSWYKFENIRIWRNDTQKIDRREW